MEIISLHSVEFRCALLLKSTTCIILEDCLSSKLTNMVFIPMIIFFNVRVSNELEAVKLHAACSVVAVSMVIGLPNDISMASLIYSLRNVWDWSFTNNIEVVQDIAHTTPYLSGLAIIYSVQAIISGIPSPSINHT